MADYQYLFFGVCIVLFFSYARFNLATYEGSARLDRLVRLVSPDKLRARGTVLKAYVFYAFMLVLIYLFLCAYGELLPFLGGTSLGGDSVLGASQLPVNSASNAGGITTGFVPMTEGAPEAWAQRLSDSDETSPGQKTDIGINPQVSLSIALIVVGLAPSFPLLKRFDEWMRRVAHHLAGIPTWIIGASDKLREERLDITIDDKSDQGGNTLLISRHDWDRLERWNCHRSTSGRNDFQDNLCLIAALSSWILEGKLELENTGLRQRFDQLEKTLLERKQELFHMLDGLGPANSSEKTGMDSQLPEQNLKRLTIERLENTTCELADDFRILVALYVEHGIVEIRQGAVEKEFDKAEKSSERSQSHLSTARQKLIEYSSAIGEESAHTPGSAHATAAWLWGFGVIFVFSVAWSIFPGRYESGLQIGEPVSVYKRALNYGFVAFGIYGLTMLVALVVRDNFEKTTVGWDRLRNRPMWTVWLPQVAFVGGVSWLVATAFMVAVVIWQSALTHGWPSIKEVGILSNIQRPFEYYAPAAMRGAILALIIIWLLDSFHSTVRTGSVQEPQKPGMIRPSRRLALAAMAGGFMALVGGVTRYLTYLAGSETAGNIRKEFEPIDAGLIFYQALYSGLVGFLVIFCVASVLAHRRLRSARNAKKRS